VKDLGIPLAMMGILTALPLTPLFDRLKKEGRLLFDRTPLSLDGETTSYNVGGQVNIVPRNFSNKTLMAGYAYLLSELFSPRNFYDRLLRQLETLKPDHQDMRKVLRWSLLFFPMLSLLIFLFMPFRLQYLRAALIALFRFPGKLMEFSFLSMCEIHYNEFVQREAVPWAQRQAERLAREEEAAGSPKRTE
jgi:hypothetical protein